jgi:tetratricopeptide (TPR) repeat protein
MKKTILLLSLLMSLISTHAQVQFEDCKTLDNLLEKAQREKKMVFIQVEADEECTQCNEVAMMSLSSTQLKEKYQTNFVSTKVKMTDSLFSNLQTRLKVEKMYGSIYLDAKGNLLLKMNQTMSYAPIYIEWADKAMLFSKKYSDIEILKSEYVNGQKSPQFLEKYIRALREVERYDPELMDEFIGKTTVDSLQTDRIVIFVQEQGLPLTSKAYKVIRALNSQRKGDSLWYLISNVERIKINNRTTFLTFQEAVRTKNNVLMNQLSEFKRNNWSKDWRRGEFYSVSLTNDFYKQINDTVGYLRSVRNFADYNLMKVSNDSLKAWDLKERNSVFEDRSFGINERRRITSESDNYAGALNNISWNVYLMSKDTMLLNKALKWTKRAIEIREKVSTTPDPESPTFIDTYAHLLYRLNRFEEAVEWQTKAVDANDKSSMKRTTFKTELDKMIARKL